MSPGIVLAGLGDIGVSAHLPALLRNPGCRLVAVVDPDPARRDAVAAMADVPAYADLEPLLADPDVRAVVLATPPWVTPGLVRTVASAGRYVLAEKPIAASVADAGILAGLSTEDTSRIQVGLTYRHDPALARLRTWIADGELGDPLLVRAHIYDEAADPADPEHGERIRATLRRGLPVVHEGAHVLDWFRFLFGAGPVGIHDAWSLRTEVELPAANLCGARLEYPGAVVLVEFGWFTRALPRCEISVLGRRAEARLDGRTFRLRWFDDDGVREYIDQPDRMTRCFDLQLGRFLRLIAGEAEPEPGLADGLGVLRLAERIADAAVAGEKGGAR